MHRALYMVFVGFTKEFDTIGRTGLWGLLRKYGWPEKFTTMIEYAYRNDGECQEWRGGLGHKQCQAGVRTGSHAFLYLSVNNSWRGFQRHGGGGRSLHPITPESRTLYSCTLLADDSALIAHSAEEIQRIVDAFANAWSRFSLKINIKRQKWCSNRTLQRPWTRTLMYTKPHKTMWDNSRISAV